MADDWTIEPEEISTAPVQEKPRRKAGRPKGSKNRARPLATAPITPAAAIEEDDNDTRGASAELLALELPRHRRFVKALITYGCNHTQAAKLAGYTGSDAVLRSTSYRLAHDPKIIRALVAESERRLTSNAAIAVKVLADFAEAEWIDPKIRLKAATEILDRAEANLSRRSEKKLIIEDNRTDTPERISNIIRMCQQLGIDAKQLLGQHNVTLDADFKVIDAAHLSAHIIEDRRQVAEDD